MSEINLLKDELKGRSHILFGWGGPVSLYVVLGILVLELFVYGAFFIYEKRLHSQAGRIEQQAAAIDFEIGKIDQQRTTAISFQRRLSNLQALLANHIFWSPVFQELEKFTLSRARYNTLQVDAAEHKFVLSGVAPSYTDLGKLILGLEQSPNISEVNLQSSSLSETAQAGYNFHLEVSFDPKLFAK